MVVPGPGGRAVLEEFRAAGEELDDDAMDLLASPSWKDRLGLEPLFWERALLSGWLDLSGVVDQQLGIITGGIVYGSVMY